MLTGAELLYEVGDAIDEYVKVENAHRAGEASDRELYEAESLLLGSILRWKRNGR